MLSKTVFTILFFLALSGCASQEKIDLEDAALSKYSCLSPKHLTVLARKWETCPPFAFKPRHASWWYVEPIVTENNRSWLDFELSKQSQLNNRDELNCTGPTVLNEIIELPPDSEIQILEMEKFHNIKAGEGVEFVGTTFVSDIEYEVHYYGYLSPEDNDLGYNLGDMFSFCSSAPVTSGLRQRTMQGTAP